MPAHTEPQTKHKAKSRYELWQDTINASLTDDRWHEYDCDIQRVVREFNNHLSGQGGYRSLARAGKIIVGWDLITTTRISNALLKKSIHGDHRSSWTRSSGAASVALTSTIRRNRSRMLRHIIHPEQNHLVDNHIQSMQSHSV